MDKGSLLFVLHAHLPFVRHPEFDQFLEERWLFEAITETYIPLLDSFERLTNDGIPFRITMSVTPPLVAMLSDELLEERYDRHITELIELAEKEVARTRHEPAFHSLACMYRDHFEHCRHVFRSYDRNLINGFRKFQFLGSLEIITCGATHGFMPLMLPVRQSVQAQIQTACESHADIFGRPPRGIWLPECGYYQGYDKELKQSGLDYFFLDNHGILHAEPRPKYGVFAPIKTPSGMVAFGRDNESSKQVWSAKEGYPGDPYYRDFYRDIGFDLDFDYIKPYIHCDGIRINTGIKYHRITGETDQKLPYEPHIARERAAAHAGNFVFNREKQIEFLRDAMGEEPVVVAPYDAELFGHWWYEGVQFLEFVMRKISCDSQTVKLTHAPHYFSETGSYQPSTPEFSSWGYKGYGEYWLDGCNDWIYPHLHAASEKMQELADRFEEPGELERRALNQAARELMLAESSDWAFIMKTGTVVPYAEKRTKDHLLRFLKLHEDLFGGTVDEKWLSEIESHDNIFPKINYRVYAS